MLPSILNLLISVLLVVFIAVGVRRTLLNYGAITLLWIFFWTLGAAAVFVYGSGEHVVAVLLILSAIVSLIGACALEFLKRAEK